MTQPVADAHDRTVRWRQLVDLLSRPHDEIDPALLDAALTMVRTGVRSVARATRAATARSIAGRASEPRLIAIFAEDRLDVAAPLLAAAPLDEAGWAIVLSKASDEVSNFIRTIRGDVAPPSEGVEAQPLPAEPAPSIGDMVARIERLKSKREASSAETGEGVDEGRPLVARSEQPPGRGLFRWECDASGQIGWVEGAPRGALIGRSLPGDEGAPRDLVRAFTDRLPFEGAAISLPAPVLEGEWRLSGIPAFSPVDGRFLGYRGIARREGDQEEAQGIAADRMLGGDAEALRETIHEIKTPLNAIIGFAEIIDGQYLGPAHRSYRLRAAEIVAQARTLLAAIEDLDFAARIKGRGQGAGEPSTLADIIPPLAEEWAGLASSRGVQLRISPLNGQARLKLGSDLANRLLKRFVGAVIEAAADGELIRIDTGEGRGKLSISITRPASTALLAEGQLLDPSFSAPSDGDGAKLGLGFALRLVRGLARLAGGNLRVSQPELTLILPIARG
jgi:signal transduction histidine kinase